MALDSTQGSLKQRGVRLTRQRQILLELIEVVGALCDASPESPLPGSGELEVRMLMR